MILAGDRDTTFSGLKGFCCCILLGDSGRGRTGVKEEGALTSSDSSSVGRSTQSGVEVRLCVTVCGSPVSSVRLEMGEV